MENTTVLSAVFEVFTETGEWFSNAITQMTPVFYANGELTLIGTICIAALSISVVLMVLAMIRSYMRFQ